MSGVPVQVAYNHTWHELRGGPLDGARTEIHDSAAFVVVPIRLDDRLRSVRYSRRQRTVCGIRADEFHFVGYEPC